MSRTQPTYRKPTYQPSEADQGQLFEWFANRGISTEIVTRNNIRLVSKYFQSLGKEVPAIAFPYFRNDEIINIKYRGLDEKAFSQEADAEKIFYGLDDLVGFDWAVIVEGELDKLAFEAAGIVNVLSVPDGAPPANSKPSGTKFEYIPNCEQELSGLKKIILAVDNDAPGKTLEAELARRLGPERCWRVQWPDN